MLTPRTFDRTDTQTALFRCCQCGRVKRLGELRDSQRRRLERGARTIRCTGCIEGTTSPLPGFKQGSAADSTYAEAFEAA